VEEAEVERGQTDWRQNGAKEYRIEQLATTRTASLLAVAERSIAKTGKPRRGAEERIREDLALSLVQLTLLSACFSFLRRSAPLRGHRLIVASLSVDRSGASLSRGCRRIKKNGGRFFSNRPPSLTN